MPCPYVSLFFVIADCSSSMRLIWCHERRRIGAARRALGDDGERWESFRVLDCRDEGSLGAAAWGEEELGVERDSSPPLESVGDPE